MYINWIGKLKSRKTVLLSHDKWNFIFIIFVGYSSASSGSSANSDGTGHTYTGTNNNGHGQFSHSQQKPGGGGFTQTGSGPGVYGPSNFGQPGFGFQYSPGFPYGPFGNQQPQFQPYPQNFGFQNNPFVPLPAFQPFQPYAPFGTFQPLQTPQEFNKYLNNLRDEYAAYVSFVSLYKFFVEIICLHLFFIEIEQTKYIYHSGGSVAQSTPGATAFASSYLGPTKYINTFFSSFSQIEISTWFLFARNSVNAHAH